jgi:integrase
VAFLETLQALLFSASGRMALRAITTGLSFRPVNRYGAVGKEALTRAGIDAKDYSGHSLRAGLVTAAAMAGVSERNLMLQPGHKNIAVLRRYIRESSVFRENGAAAVGL